MESGDLVYIPDFDYFGNTYPIKTDSEYRAWSGLLIAIDETRPSTIVLTLEGKMIFEKSVKYWKQLSDCH